VDVRAWDERYATGDLVWGSGPNRFVEAECADLVPGRALDLACGEGRNAIWLAERGWQAEGVDWSAVAIDKAKQLAAQRGVPGATFRVADLLEFELDAGAFDLVLIAYLQVGALARAVVFARAVAAVAPGGTLLVVAHDGHNLAAGTGGPQDPSVLYEPDDIVASLPAGEFTVARADHVDRPVDGAERPAIDLLVRAQRLR
jgi:SAM-dependent methyltransferase